MDEELNGSREVFDVSLTGASVEWSMKDRMIKNQAARSPSRPSERERGLPSGRLSDMRVLEGPVIEWTGGYRST